MSVRRALVLLVVLYVAVDMYDPMAGGFTADPLRSVTDPGIQASRDVDQLALDVVTPPIVRVQAPCVRSERPRAAGITLSHAARHRPIRGAVARTGDPPPSSEDD